MSIGVESALLPRHNSIEYIALKLNNIANLESCGVMNQGKIHKTAALDDAFAVFQFDPNTTGKQFFKEGDVRPNHRELRTPIGKLAKLDVSWETSKYYNSIDSNSWYDWYDSYDFSGSSVDNNDFRNNSIYYKSTATYLETKKFKVFWVEIKKDSADRIIEKRYIQFTENSTYNDLSDKYSNSNVFIDSDTTVKYYIETVTPFNDLKDEWNSTHKTIISGAHNIVFKITTCS